MSRCGPIEERQLSEQERQVRGVGTRRHRTTRFRTAGCVSSPVKTTALVYQRSTGHPTSRRALRSLDGVGGRADRLPPVPRAESWRRLRVRMRRPPTAPMGVLMPDLNALEGSRTGRRLQRRPASAGAGMPRCLAEPTPSTAIPASGSPFRRPALRKEGGGARSRPGSSSSPGHDVIAGPAWTRHRPAGPPSGPWPVLRRATAPLTTELSVIQLTWRHV